MGRNNHHAHLHAHQAREADYETVVSVVYVTATPTFDGPVAGYTTLNTLGSPAASNVAGTPMDRTRDASLRPSHSVPGRLHKPSEVMALSSTVVPLASSSSEASEAATSSLMASPTPDNFAASSAIAPAATSDTSSSNSSSGMSGGAKAGLAIGILLIIGLVAGLIFFAWRRKKSQNDGHQQLDDEKSGFQRQHASQMSQSSIASRVSVRRNNNLAAPRLSLRPVTDMFPAMSEKQENGGAANLVAQSAASANKTPEPANRDLNEKSDAANPFGDHQEAVAEAAAAVEAPKPLAVKSDRTSTGSDQSTGSGSGSVSGARGPGANNVHRVQLDFKPSMDDELELRAGSLVRLLHEYDDGWALCIRLDRSQQGVVPRTCISKLPVKPRPGPPPGARGPPPQGRARAGSNANSPRVSPNSRQQPFGSPNSRARSQTNGPMGGQRPASPGPFGSGQYSADNRPRSNSASSANRRNSPPGISPLNPTAQPNGIPSRKPVPGQAL